MKALFLVLLCEFLVAVASGQALKEYRVKAGEISGKTLPNEAKYMLPAFKMGTAFFRDGSSSNTFLNYNFLLDEMHFINESGDTVAIAEPGLIRIIALDSMNFYYDRGFLCQIMKLGDYKLAVRRQMIQISDKKRGGYDAATAGAAIDTYASISTGNGPKARLQVQKDVLFKEELSFYLADFSNTFFKANKKGFYALFPEEKIKSYTNGHKVNFKDEADLKALFQFCALP